MKTACGFDSHGFRLNRHGVMVQQDDASSARWRSGCDSRWLHLKKHGPVVQRRRRLVHTQETMVRLHPGPLRLGRQPADHLGLEPGMLWVRLPPEPLKKIESSWSSLECSLARHARDRGFKSRRGRLDEMARYANRQSGQAQILVIAGSTPACATAGCVPHGGL